MNQFNKARVIMLPTERIVEERIGYYKNGLSLYERRSSNTNKILSYENSFDSIEISNPQHLYIISEDQKQKGDWCYDTDSNSILLLTKEINESPKRIWLKKVLATTDTSLLKFREHCNIIQEDVYDIFPQPSQQFIQRFIEAFNKGKVITDVLVEYNEPVCKCNTSEELNKCYYANGEDCTRKCVNGDFYGLNLKVNPKNNTITIKESKESWNREEVETLITNAFKAGYERSASGYPNTDNHMKPNVDKWIEENL